MDSVELDAMAKKAQKIVLTFSGTSGATGAIPIPFADAPLLVAQQIAMMAAVSGAFEFDGWEDRRCESPENRPGGRTRGGRRNFRRDSGRDYIACGRGVHSGL